MEEDIIPSKFLVDQIIDEILIKIEKQEEFDAVTFTKIKELADNGDLKNVTKIIEALRCQDEIIVKYVTFLTNKMYIYYS